MWLDHVMINPVCDWICEEVLYTHLILATFKNRKFKLLTQKIFLILVQAMVPNFKAVSQTQAFFSIMYNTRKYYTAQDFDGYWCFKYLMEIHWQIVTYFSICTWPPVVFKIFDGLNFDWLTEKHQILHYTITLSIQLSWQEII